MAIRPPGAISEANFLAACTRCGLCVRDCPYQILELAKLGSTDVATGIAAGAEGCKGRPRPPAILSAECTNCARCIDICGENVFELGLRFNPTETAGAEDLTAPAVEYAA